MAYNPSIHTASNKPYGVTNKPVDARYWYYDSALYLYRPYNTIAEVLSYLIANDRKGATVQIEKAEYWWPNSSDLSDVGLVVKSTRFEVINIPANSATPIIINFDNSTIKYGADSPENLDVNLLSFKANPTIWYELNDAGDDTLTTPYNNVQTIAKQWADNTKTSLVSLAIKPDTVIDEFGVDTEETIDNINIIIKA